MLENSFWRVGIIFCFRMSQYMLESMFPSMNRSSPVPAVVMQPQTMMLPPHLTVGKAQFSWYSSTGHRHTCWTPSESNKFTLDSSNHRTWFQSFMLLARLSSVNCLHAILWASFRRAFLLGRRLCTPTCCSVWRNWQAELPLLQLLKQCRQLSYVCFFKPASASNAQHKDSTSLIDPCEACSKWNHLEKPLHDPGHCTITPFQAVTELLIA